MPIVSPTDLQKPDILKAIKVPFPLSKVLQINYPCYTEVGVRLQGPYSFTFQSPIEGSVGLTNHIANAGLQEVPGSNCGIVIVHHLWVNPLQDELCKLFILYLEDYLKACRYSVLLATDGISAGNRTHNFIKKYGEGWEIHDAGLNRRMAPKGDPNYRLFVMYKELQWSIGEKRLAKWHAE